MKIATRTGRCQRVNQEGHSCVFHAMRKIPAALAATVLLAIAACGSQSPTTPTTAPAAAASSPPSCRQQYLTWKYGPAKALADKMEATLNALQSASSAENIPQTTADFEAAAKDASALIAMPPPHCADPAGYYGQMLSRVVAAGDNAKSATGLASLMLAEVPLKGFTSIESKLSAEMARTVGAES